MSVVIHIPKKLIEVALPLDKINEACVKEASPFTPRHPRSLHIWWARRRLAAARSVIFAQMVNDPSWKWELEHPDETPPPHLKASWASSRKRLFSLIEEIVAWENTANEAVFSKAHAEIKKSWAETCEVNKDHPDAHKLFNPNCLPGLHDPFAGGGAIPLEAQRLGLSAFASDLNPVPVLINKALIEIPPLFSGRGPVNPNATTDSSLLPVQWTGSQGLAADLQYYGEYLLAAAKGKIGHLYPQIEITKDVVAERPDLKGLLGRKLNATAFIWARTVKSPNPAVRDVDVPLATTFVLSSKAGKEAYVQPVIENGSYRFEVRIGSLPDHSKRGTAAGKRAGFLCILSQSPIDYKYIRQEGRDKRMGQKLLAVVADGPRGKLYISPTAELEKAGLECVPQWSPDVSIAENPRNFQTPNYGLGTFGDLFTPRQLVVLTTFSELIGDVRERIFNDAVAAGVPNDNITLAAGGDGAQAYADALAVYCGLALSRWTDMFCALSSWNNTNQNIRGVFSRQAIPMVWDFVESNPFGGGASFGSVIETICKLFPSLPSSLRGVAIQADAVDPSPFSNSVISTDPPYYDNINYSELSDFFYVWLRRALQPVFPELLSTVATPKITELVANTYRHHGDDNAEKFFLEGMKAAMGRIARETHPAFPVTLYYAFKQSESDATSGTGSTGWETFLDAFIGAGFALTGTWPMRTERTEGIKQNMNALASSIVLVGRARSMDAPTISRRSFIRELNATLPEAMDGMTRGSGGEASPIAPVDLSQAIIGPGMAIFSRYSAVLEADGSPMTVKNALRLVNRFLAEDDFDAETQFCLHWFEQHGWDEGAFGEADQLARAKGAAVNGIQQAGVIRAAAGRVVLLRPTEYPVDWDHSTDSRLPVWEVLHQLIRLFRSGGYEAASEVLAAVASKADAARQLAYRLYTLCERAGWTDDARAYNEIITSWAAIEDAAARAPKPSQSNLFDA